ncbi:MAG: recombinase family protein [Bacteroidota bacterium]
MAKKVALPKQDDLTQKTVAYIRASTNKQDVDNQKLEILEYARKHDLKVDEFIEITISSKRTTKQRRIDELLEKLQDSGTLIATELSRLGRSTAEVISLINQLLKQDVRVILTKQNLDITTHDMASKIIVTLFSLFAELERDLISLRTKEALAAKKAKGIQLGKPKGTIQKSMYDKDLELIKDWVALGISGRRISENLGYGSYISLNTFLRKRGLRDSASKS